MRYAVSIGDEFTDLFGNVVSVAVKVLIFLAIVALGWLVARWVRKALSRLLQRAGFDRAVHRGGLDRMLGKYPASDVIAQLVFLAVMLFVLQLAFGIFGPNPVSDLISRVIAWLPRLFVAVIIVVVAAAIAGWVREIIAEALGGLSYGKAIATAAQVLILVLGIIAALNQVGVATTVTVPVLVAVLAAIVGVIVVGVGGGLIKPMQHRWERVLNRAETETSLAAEKVRAHRAARAPTVDRDANVPGGFPQPAYGTATASTAVKPPGSPPPSEPTTQPMPNVPPSSATGPAEPT
jgi:hypothetical protein